MRKYRSKIFLKIKKYEFSILKRNNKTQISQCQIDNNNNNNMSYTALKIITQRKLICLTA